MATTAPLNVRIDEKLKDVLQELSEVTERSMAYHTAKALEEYVAREQFFIEKTREGLAEADRKEFATDPEVDRVFNKYAS